jgi:hypothetical protein
MSICRFRGPMQECLRFRDVVARTEYHTVGQGYRADCGMGGSPREAGWHYGPQRRARVARSRRVPLIQRAAARRSGSPWRRQRRILGEL